MTDDVKKYFSKQGHILDIEPGSGRYSLMLLKSGYNVSLSNCRSRKGWL